MKLFSVYLKGDQGIEILVLAETIEQAISKVYAKKGGEIALISLEQCKEFIE